MARRKSGGTGITPASAKSHKRQLSETPTATPGSRASKRLKDSAQKPGSIKTTPTKSKYFEDVDSEEPEEDSASDDAAESGYEDQDESEADQATTASESDEEENDYSSEEDTKKGKKSKKAKPGASKSALATVLDKGKELWRQGVSTGLGPGKQVFIERPKPRGDGGIKYEPAQIHPNTMEFLKDLKKNNDREWLKSK